MAGAGSARQPLEPTGAVSTWELLWLQPVPFEATLATVLSAASSELTSGPVTWLQRPPPSVVTSSEGS